jgi:outer membrane murein-binding lipoprotein Lpp
MDRVPSVVRSQDTERNARELLARWSTQHILEPPIASGPAPTTAASPLDPRPIPVGIVPATGKASRRFDAPHASVIPPVMSPAETSQRSASEIPREARPKRRRRKNAERPRLAEVPHENPAIPPAPTHDAMVRMAVQEPLARHVNWTTTVGQLCAYGGVGVLTLGTVMVLAGYFGGPSNYAPTGWQVAAVGQMLLFLGVVTLVSGGMEQTVDEVAWRIDHLAEQIMRLEQVITEQESERKEARRRENRRSRFRRDDQADAA